MAKGLAMGVDKGHILTKIEVSSYKKEKRLFQDLRMDEIKEKLVNRKIDIEQKRIQKLR